MHNRV